MDNIELFDSYIKEELSQQERVEFDNRLKSDKEFATEFKLFLFSVNGICRETEQDDKDFEIAMKKLTKEQLQEIIGTRKLAEIPVTTEPSKGLRFKTWMWQATSIAAVVVIAFTFVFQFERQSQYNVDNAIYAFADEEVICSTSRGGAEQVDITKLNDEELSDTLPELVKLYNNATDEQEVADNGYVLVMAYVRLHNRGKARDILAELIQRFDNNEAFRGAVKKYKSIQQLIK